MSRVVVIGASLHVAWLAAHGQADGGGQECGQEF